MKLILNIGLARTNNSNIGVGTALRDLASHGFKIEHHAVVHSDTEITVVAEVDDNDQPGTDNRVHLLSNLLGQDCIAVYNPETREGDLIGPRAAAWGAFSPEFFILADGTRLASPLQAAA
jgi:hypothetical protein